MKKRPRIRLRVPAGVTAGSTFDVEVVLDAAKPVDIEYVQLAFEGQESARRGSGEHARRVSRSVARQAARLCEARKLPAGRTSFTCRISLPPDAPPTYRGRGAEVVYRLDVRVSIPWWPDARGSWEIGVARPASVTPDPPDPIVYSTAPDGPKGREAYLEVSLPTRATPAGRGLEGVIALGNVASNRYRGLRLSLRGVERLNIRGADSESTIEDYRLPVAIGTAEEGKGIPFSFLVPQTAYPSYASASGIWSRVWWFEVRAEVRLGFDVVATFPVRILPQGTARATSGRARFAAPTVGTERLVQVWAAAAASVGFAADGEALRGRVGDTEIELRREPLSGAVGVVGRLRYPPLHLGLSLAHPTFRGARVIGRMPAQVDKLLEGISHLLRPLSLTQLDDTALSCEWRDAGHARLRLISFANDLKALAAAIGRARKEIPPPWAMADSVPAWERLAAALDGGRLVIATMEAHGAFEGQPVAIRTEWDGVTPARTVVELSPRAPLALEPGKPLAGDARTIVELLSEGAVSFRAAPGALTLVLPAPQRDHEPLLAALRRMTRLAGLLRARAAVYR